MNFEKAIEFYNAHRGGLIGALIGFFVAIAFLLFGFFKVLFIALLAGVGYYIGKRIHDDKDYIKNLLDRVLPPGTYR
jgi:Small integral membrane protein